MYFQLFRESATISIFSLNEFILTPAATWIGEVDQIRNSIQMENQGINVVKKRKQGPVHFYTFISFVFIPPQLLWFWLFFFLFSKTKGWDWRRKGRWRPRSGDWGREWSDCWIGRDGDEHQSYSWEGWTVHATGKPFINMLWWCFGWPSCLC